MVDTDELTEEQVAGFRDAFSICKFVNFSFFLYFLFVLIVFVLFPSWQGLIFQSIKVFILLISRFFKILKDGDGTITTKELGRKR
jgi:hypothetical protein